MTHLVHGLAQKLAAGACSPPPRLVPCSSWGFEETLEGKRRESWGRGDEGGSSMLPVRSQPQVMEGTGVIKRMEKLWVLSGLYGSRALEPASQNHGSRSGCSLLLGEGLLGPATLSKGR